MSSAVIPVSPLRSAKSRLKDILTPEERKNLIKSMLLDVYIGLKDACDSIYVVSRDREILSFSRELGIIPILEKNTKDLNDALKYAIERIEDNTVAIVPADIPLIRREDIKRLINKVENRKRSVLICPSRGGGTNLLILNPKDVIEPSYEGFSFLKHLELCKRNKVKLYIYSSFYISVDINTPEDLGEIFIHGRDTYTYKYLKELGISVYPRHSSAGRFLVVRDYRDINDYNKNNYRR